MCFLLQYDLMSLAKKILFAPFFLICFSWLLWQFKDLLANPFSPLNYLFESLNQFSLTSPYSFINSSNEMFITLTLFILPIFLTSLFFVIFSALAQDLKIVGSVIFVSLILPFIFLPLSFTIIFLGFGFMVFLVIFYAVYNKMLHYIDFKPGALLSSSIRYLTIGLILVMSVSYFLAVNLKFQSPDFAIPDQVIDSIIKMSTSSFNPSSQLLQLQGFKTTKLAQSQPTITPEQLEMLRNNPELLKQFGLDPSVLDSFNNSPSSGSTTKPSPTSSTRRTTPSTSPSNIPSLTPNLLDPSSGPINSLLKGQIEGIIKPLLPFLPFLFASSFFMIIFSQLFFLTILTTPLLWFVFWILEKSKLVHFEKEMREVRKLVV